MSSETRKTVIEAIASVNMGLKPEETLPVSEYFGCNVFNHKTMARYVSKESLAKLVGTANEGLMLDASIAEEIAQGMKKWAIENGATHYTHWFLPLNGSTAEKHEAFIEPKNEGVIMNFSGKNLIMGESDASSFPSGGLRSTFEARGYTAWDPTSPAFIKRGRNTATLCIPTIFCSFTGQVLDKKTPILRSIQAITREARRMMKVFGTKKLSNAQVTLGAEQEYFLVDKRLYILRPDLIQCGRTLFGAPPAKHQQLEDHYFGSINPRILAFMMEVDRELWKLGIPAKTRHNEVAPAQFEIAPIFEELNLAIDHNMLIMEILRQYADRHGLVCLLHEKPFAGVNGSGKHNNWSICVDGVNLLNPGNNPHQNAIFLTTLCSIIQAVDRHSDLLRATTASAGNDYRLGANEAPPAIISIFLGDQLTDIIEQIENGGAKSSKVAKIMKVGVDALPPLQCDVSDRNRTSPFAFTNNKFEFRAPGSSQSCASPNIVINTIVADSMREITNILEAAKPEEFNNVLQKTLHSIIKKHRRIIFNGDNYTAKWREEAACRGLPNLATTPEALKPFIAENSIELFKKHNVFSKEELHSRYEVFLAEYKRKVRIEAELALNMARTQIVPAVVDYLARVATTLSHEKLLGLGKNSHLKNLAENIRTLLDEVCMISENLDKAIKGKKTESEIIAITAELRKPVDSLELLVDDSIWPLPKYRELLFIY